MVLETKNTVAHYDAIYMWWNPATIYNIASANKLDIKKIFDTMAVVNPSNIWEHAWPYNVRANDVFSEFMLGIRTEYINKVSHIINTPYYKKNKSNYVNLYKDVRPIFQARGKHMQAQLWDRFHKWTITRAEQLESGRRLTINNQYYITTKVLIHNLWASPRKTIFDAEDWIETVHSDIFQRAENYKMKEKIKKAKEITLIWSSHSTFSARHMIHTANPDCKIRIQYRTGKTNQQIKNRLSPLYRKDFDNILQGKIDNVVLEPFQTLDEIKEWLNTSDIVVECTWYIRNTIPLYDFNKQLINSKQIANTQWQIYIGDDKNNTIPNIVASWLSSPSFWQQADVMKRLMRTIEWVAIPQEVELITNAVMNMLVNSNFYEGDIWIRRVNTDTNEDQKFIKDITIKNMKKIAYDAFETEKKAKTYMDINTVYKPKNTLILEAKKDGKMIPVWRLTASTEYFGNYEAIVLEAFQISQELTNNQSVLKNILPQLIWNKNLQKLDKPILFYILSNKPLEDIYNSRILKAMFTDITQEVWMSWWARSVYGYFPLGISPKNYNFSHKRKLLEQQWIFK